MSLGAFSVSLSVKDLVASRRFYEALGFSVLGGSEEHNYLIMQQGDALVGLFQGMFEGTMLTFNPGWDQNAQNVDPFTDLREIKQKAIDAGLEISQDTGAEAGPGSFMVIDPDGTPILFDQHR